MIKICDRCHNNFECSSNNIQQCQCSTISLEKETIEYLSKTSYDCLCEACLIEVNEFAEKSKIYSFPKHPSQYVEGVHYYIEGSYWVFTNFYHYLKGSCCRNNCRHCAYGFK